MALEGFLVRKTSRRFISAFIEENHYSGNINGCVSDYCFSLHYPSGVMCGALFYGRMAMAGQWERFSTKKGEVTELRRLCCVDNTPKNAESYFIGSTLRWLKKNTNISTVVSYADLEHGHQGTVYKASNFTHEGTRPGAKVILFDGKSYHDKTIRTKYKGKLKPYAVNIIDALESGRAVYKETKGKVCYTYTIKRKPRSPKGEYSKGVSVQLKLF